MKTAKFPKTRLKDYLRFTEELGDLYIKKYGGELSPQDYDIEITKLEQRYKNTVFEEDTYRFNNVHDLSDFLYENHLDSTGITHEVEHAEEARKLGYDVFFLCILTHNKWRVYNQLGVMTKQDLTPEDYIKLLSVPEEMSDTDKIRYDALVKK